MLTEVMLLDVKVVDNLVIAPFGNFLVIYGY